MVRCCAAVVCKVWLDHRANQMHYVDTGNGMATAGYDPDPPFLVFCENFSRGGCQSHPEVGSGLGYLFS